jgi:CMP/dCMP kinase
MSMNQVPIITLDGPSGTGKGTISLMLARHLNWHYLDSGAIYRVLAYAAVQHGVNVGDVSALSVLARALDLRFDVESDNQTTVFLNNQNITDEIRTEACGQNASKIAAISEVRVALLERQRDFAVAPGLVTDGRDMGTVVFPNADLKLYLDASSQERAMRRYKQLKEKGNDVSLAQVVEELTKRDDRDKQRLYAPLKPADDAVIIDTDSLNIVQVFDNVLELARKKGFA